jgi:peptide/nickel transport system substrate-binding protein
VWLYEYILPEHIWSKYANDYKAAKAVTNAPSVGSGPYIIKSYVKGTSVELDRNPYYWGDSVGLHPQVDRVIYQIFGSQDSEAAALQNGSIDFGYFSSANTLNTLKQRGLETRGAIVPAFDEIGINTGSAYQTDPTGGFVKHGDGAEALTDPILREAMRKAVDSPALINSVLKGYGSVAISPVLNPPLSTAASWSPGPTDPDLSFNIAAANTMLDNAGYKMGADGIRIDPKTNKPLEFRIYSRSSDQNSQDIVPFVQAWMKQIGIKLDPTTLTSGKLGNVILAGDYDLFVWGWYPNPDPNYILNIFTCQQRPPNAGTYRNSDSYYCNPAYDKLYQQQLTATTQSARDVAIKAEQEMLYKDQPYLILWSAATLEAWSSKWTGFISQPSGSTGDVLATYGPFSFINLRPVLGSGGSSSSSGGLSPGIIIAIIAAIVVIGGAVMLMRRKDAEDEA